MSGRGDPCGRPVAGRGRAQSGATTRVAPTAGNVGVLAARPRLLPLQKFLEQFIGICRRGRPAQGATLRRSELPEIRLQARHVRVASRGEPLLRRVETLPTFHSDGKIDLAPFWMVR